MINETLIKFVNSFDYRVIVGVRDSTLCLFTKQRTKFTLFDPPKTLKMTSRHLESSLNLQKQKFGKKLCLTNEKVKT